MALHGGAWVTAVIGNPVMWLVACLVGSIVGCLILSLWQKPLQSEEPSQQRDHPKSHTGGTLIRPWAPA